MRPMSSNAADALGSPVRNLVVILGFVAVVMVASTLGYMHAGWSLADASYMVVLTIYTVGYGEVRPIDTQYLHAVTMATMVFGCTGMILLTSVLIQVFTALQLRALFGVGRMQNAIAALDAHVIIAGYGRIGVMLAHELKTAGRDLVVIERSPAKIAEAEAAGHLCIAADATDEAALVTAGINRAQVLATVLPDDAANVFITLSARSLNPRVQIIARGEAPTTEGKLRHAGADRVVLPTHIGAERIAEMILYAASSGLVRGNDTMAENERLLQSMGLEFEMLTVPKGGGLTGARVADAERRGAGSFFIVQIERKGGGVITRPDPGTRIEAGDGIGYIARGNGAAIRALFDVIPEAIRSGRSTFKPGR
ncbi:potassium channel protein [Polymorphobacter arshaanensis]|uniref:Potassium channel protein n=2 Tax=Glacieibacterium arshaanense TaxID=2511025 RepID=A0A4Y9EP97_9SPHN|nr:potassium channel protein [Polymorphobacter arshaanensis]